MTLGELEKVVTSLRMPKFTARQIAQWLYEKKVTDFSEMANISKKNQALLAEQYCVGRVKPETSQRSQDGTVKYLFPVAGGRKIESVYIPDKERATLCVSSQSGCKMNCFFCATGKMGFKSQLTAAEIINQVLSVPPVPKPGETPMTPLSNIVFMGMGEPLDNFREVKKVIEILTSDWGLAWSPKRITVSTVGKMPELKDLLDSTQVHVAISVHNADLREREAMMPAQKAFPMQNIINLLKDYDFSHQRRLSIEYIMWRGVNDNVAHANMLIRLISGLDCRVNLIRYHAIEGIDLSPCSEERMVMFRNILNKHGITVTIRTSRGEDIMAACGMLANTSKSR